MIRGESVKCLIDYDLFGTNVKDMEGCFVKLDETTGKALVWFSCNEEWAEILLSDLKRLNPDTVCSKYENFISRIRTLEYTFVT